MVNLLIFKTNFSFSFLSVGKNISYNEKVLKMLKMAYDELQILAGTFLPFFISFNTVLAAGRSSYDELQSKHRTKVFNKLFF